MTTEDAIRYYGSKSKIARALECAPQSVQKWGYYPPRMRQYQMEVVTRRKLRVEPELMLK